MRGRGISHQRGVSPVMTLMVLSWLAACEGQIIRPPEVEDPPANPVVLSNPGAAASLAAGAAARVAGSGAQSDIVYVSLLPGMVDDGQLAQITNERTGAISRTAMAHGGFDPVPIAASADDTLGVQVESADGSTTYLAAYVPRERSPTIIRTSPPRGKRDVVLNAVIRIVFSEPMDPATITSPTVRLTSSAGTVSGELTLSADGLYAELRPHAPLAPNTDYTLSVSGAVMDLDGAPVTPDLEVEFATGTTTAVAEVYTNPAALYVVNGYPPLDGRLRTAEFQGVLHDDARFTGTFRLYYPEEGWTTSGSLLCFGISGDTVWVSGLIEYRSHTGDGIGTDIAWYAVDNGAPAEGVPDRLSLVKVGISDAGWGTTQDHCNQRPTTLLDGTDRVIQDVETGDIVVTGATPPPLPPPAPAHLAFTSQPQNALSGRPIAVGVAVRALDDSRTRTAAFDGDVTITLGANPGGATLTGTTTVTAQGGVAIFDDLIVSAPGRGYTLVASATDLSLDTSDTFDVVAPPVGGRIAFYDSEGIRVMNPDGSGVAILMDDPADGPFSHTLPAWSPDGDRIAFSSSRAGNRDIYVVSSDGTGLTRLTSDPATDDAPDWSADGTRIVFSSERGQGWADIYVMNADGSDVQRLTNDPAWDGYPAWSPDGTKIVFASDRDSPTGDIHVMNTDGSAITRLTHDPITEDMPDWSPDGTMIAYHAHDVGYPVDDTGGLGGVWVMNSDGSAATQLTYSGGGAPTWSPDGRTLAYYARYLYLIKADGSDLVNLGIEGDAPDWSSAPGVAGVASPSSDAGPGR